MELQMSEEKKDLQNEDNLDIQDNDDVFEKEEADILSEIDGLVEEIPAKESPLEEDKDEAENILDKEQEVDLDDISKLKDEDSEDTEKLEQEEAKKIEDALRKDEILSPEKDKGVKSEEDKLPKIDDAFIKDYSKDDPDLAKKLEKFKGKPISEVLNSYFQLESKLGESKPKEPIPEKDFQPIRSNEIQAIVDKNALSELS